MNKAHVMYRSEEDADRAVEGLLDRLPPELATCIKLEQVFTVH